MKSTNYHSFLGQLLNQVINDDYKMSLNINKLDKLKLEYDIIIVDECQDMTILYYQLVKKIL